MHVSDLNSYKRIGGSRLTRGKVETDYFDIIVVADLGYIFEYALPLFRYDLKVNVVFTVAVRSIPVYVDESLPVLFPEIADVRTVNSVDCYALALGNVSYDRISRYRVAACRSSDEKIVSSLDNDS